MVRIENEEGCLECIGMWLAADQGPNVVAVLCGTAHGGIGNEDQFLKTEYDEVSEQHYDFWKINSGKVTAMPGRRSYTLK